MPKKTADDLISRISSAFATIQREAGDSLSSEMKFKIASCERRVSKAVRSGNPGELMAAMESVSKLETEVAALQSMTTRAS